MKNSKGVTLAVLLVTIIVMIIIASVGVYTGVRVINDAKENREKEDFAAVENMVQTYKNRNTMSGVILPGGYTYPGIQNPTINGVEIGNDWYLLDEDAITEILDASYANRYIVNYELCIVIDKKEYETATYNEPLLVNNLIPVYYDGGWKKADSTNASNSWYKYDTVSKKWANAVTVVENKRGTYTSASVGTLIPESDIIGMFVWIPRYAYKITSGEHTSTGGTIDILFLKGTTDKYLVGSIETLLPPGYKVHPSFENGATTNYKNGEWSKEISGFWVAKFEASSSEATADCTFDANGNLTTIENLAADRKIDTYGRTNNTVDNVTVRPNVTSWRAIIVKDIYAKCTAMGSYHGLSNLLSSHMMKNSEWGAVAYLTQSNYGYNAGGDNVWNNPYSEGNGSEGNGIDTTLTGMVGTSRDQYIKYDLVKSGDRIINSNGTVEISYTGDTSSSRTYSRYYTSNGQNGSTTGNVYGIYDMAGGAWEYMASYVDNGHQFIASYAPSTTSSSLLQIYESNGMGSMRADYELLGTNGIYGDAMYETSSSYSSSCSWNGDYSIFPFSSNPFFLRGGGFDRDSSAGVFAFSFMGGNPIIYGGFRPVLSPL